MSGLATMEREGTRGRGAPASSRAGEEHLDAEHGDDGADEGNDQRLDVAESPALQEENEQHVESGDEHAVEEGDVEEELEGNGRADDLGQVAGGDGHFSAQPEHKADPGTVVLVDIWARSRSVATPSLSDRLCNRMAMRLEAMMTNRRV